MLLVRLLVHSRLLVVKPGGSKQLYTDFHLHGKSAPLMPALSKVNCSSKSAFYYPSFSNSWLLLNFDENVPLSILDQTALSSPADDFQLHCL